MGSKSGALRTVFFNETATTEIYTLSLRDALPIYFGSVIPSGDNKFAALNTAVWSGGSFIYVPKGVHVEIPLQAYFRIKDRKSTRLNSSHANISYAVFCLKTQTSLYVATTHLLILP